MYYVKTELRMQHEVGIVMRGSGYCHCVVRPRASKRSEVSEQYRAGRVSTTFPRKTFRAIFRSRRFALS